MDMEHGEYDVELLDDCGNVVGKKKRKDIDKKVDCIHLVQMLLMTQDGRLLLSHIPSDAPIKKIFGGLIGTTAATMIRVNETPEQAARRALQNELFLPDLMPTFLGRHVETFPPYAPTLTEYYRVTVDQVPTHWDRTQIVELIAMLPDDLTDRMMESPESFAPSLVAFWQRFLHHTS